VTSEYHAMPARRLPLRAGHPGALGQLVREDPEQLPPALTLDVLAREDSLDPPAVPRQQRVVGARDIFAAWLTPQDLLAEVQAFGGHGHYRAEAASVTSTYSADGREVIFDQLQEEADLVLFELPSR
jgi:hypothetical protein